MYKLFSKEEEQYILENYNDLKIVEIANKLSRSKSSINHKIRNMGLKPIRDYWFNKSNKDSLNHYYFGNYTPESSYWAGFIAADGCIINVKNKSLRLVITLSIRDFDHLNKFNNALNNIKNLYIIESSKYKTNKKGTGNLCRLSISSDFICSDLKSKYNITSRKSLTFSLPEFNDLSILDAFIAGYIDGDGYISKKQDKITIAGTLKCLEVIRSRFDTILNKSFPVKISKINNHYTLEYGGRKQVHKIIKHFKTYNLPLMQRKWGIKNISEEF